MSNVDFCRDDITEEQRCSGTSRKQSRSASTSSTSTTSRFIPRATLAGKRIDGRSTSSASISLYRCCIVLTLYEIYTLCNNLHCLHLHFATIYTLPYHFCTNITMSSTTSDVYWTHKGRLDSFQLANRRASAAKGKASRAGKWPHPAISAQKVDHVKLPLALS
jgi:hypothetical protein